MDNMELPFKPYAGTSGWRGSDASLDRVIEDDNDGTQLTAKNKPYWH